MVNLTGIILVLFLHLLHPFHVSVNEISFNDESKSLEITKKIFTDDLELALKNSGNLIYLTKNHDDKINVALQQYLTDKFMITINGKQEKLNYIGYEIEEDALWCYFQIDKVRNIRNITVFDATLLETYNDQVNLVHLNYKENVKSFKLDQSMSEKEISF